MRRSELAENDVVFLRDSFPFWDAMSHEDARLLVNNTGFMSCRSGDNVHGGSNDCVGVVLVKTGELRTYILSEGGKEVTLYRLFPGDACILSASCMIKNITFDVHIDAVKDSEIFLLDVIAFEEIKRTNPAVEAYTNELITQRFSDVMWVMEQVLFMSVDRRLAIFLIDQSAADGTDTVRMTHEMIARHIGSAREVISRMLKYFANEGIVSLSRGGVTITDKKRLRSLTR